MENIINVLETKKIITYEESFSMALYCAKLLAQTDEKDYDKARKIIIHVLNQLRKIPKETYDIWADLIESVGFYPYLMKNRDLFPQNTLSDEIRIQSYKSDYIPEKFMHIKQRELEKLLLSGKNVVASAPTSFGKSMLIEEIVASNKYKNIVIIQPTLALLDETRIKLKKYSDRYKIIVRTSQCYDKDNGNLFLLTAERVMEYEEFPNIELLIIDEFYKLSLRRKDGRANVLNNAFLRIINTFNSKFYLLGPNIDGITKGFEKKYDAVFFKSNYSLVDAVAVDMNTKLGQNLSSSELEKRRVKVLCELLVALQDEQTLIYCSSPARVRKYAKEFCDYLSKNGIKSDNDLPLSEWIEENISNKWSLIKELRYGVAIHDGSLQKHIGASIIDYFNNRKLKYIFCTSTIIEGVNTSAKNVIIFDGKKGSNELDFFDYSNIKGRSGRMMEHYVGKIYNFIPIPQEQKMIVDIPFYEQDSNVLTDEILINIPDKDVKDGVRSRYDKLNEIPSQLISIIKKNGTSVDGQLKIYYALERDIKNGQYKDIAWIQMPEYGEILYVLRLAENNTYAFDRGRAVVSVEQLTTLLNKYRTTKSLKDIANSIYEYKRNKVRTLTSEREQKYYDQAIEETFHIYRHWFQFAVPKAFRVVDSLQRYVCEKNGLKPGSYSFLFNNLKMIFYRKICLY